MTDETPKRAQAAPASPPASETGRGASAGTRPNTMVAVGITSQATEPELRTGGAIAGYEVLDELGRGAMGVVFRARHVKLNRVVALKMAFGGRVDSKDLIRFLAEAEAVAAVKHENVVQVYDYGEAGGQPYMALEYCPAGSLSALLKTEAPLHPLDAAETVGRISEGVAAAHELGIVHRDLKPGNILLQVDARAMTQAGLGPEDIDTLPLEELCPKVSDFGLAKRAASDLTATQAVMGTPAYMSPEQAVGKTKFVGPQADVWALGVILYECLTGTRPFYGETAYDVLAQILTEEPVSVRTLRATVPHDLELVVRKCLEKNPADRYATARELADDLNRFVRGEPISVRPLSTATRVKRWVKRNKAVTALLAAVALITLGLMGSLYAQNRQANAQVKAERRAKEGAKQAQESAERAAEETKRREEAEVAAARSAAEAAQANALGELLNDLFRSSDPLAEFFGDAAPVLGVAAATEGQAAILGPFLRNAADRIRKSKPDPATALGRAKMLASIGNGMKNLGLFTEAKPILEEALALRRQRLPDTDPAVWQSELDMGKLEVEGGDLVTAIERFRRVLVLQKKARADQATMLTTRFYEGVAMSAAGMPEAGNVLREVLDGRQKLNGNANRETALAKLGLMSFLLEQGEFSEVLVLFNEFRADMRALPNPRIREVFEPILDAQEKMAKGLGARQAGSFGMLLLKPAADGLRTDIARLEKLIPEDHLALFIFRFELAVFLVDLNEGKEADELFARVLSDVRKTVGLAHPKVILLLEAYAQRLVATGNAARARELFVDVEKANRERFGPENPWLTIVLLKRARFEYKQGDPVAALVALKGAVALVQREKFLPTPSAMSEVFETATQLGTSASPPDLRTTARELFAGLRSLVGKVFGAQSNLMVVILTAEGQQHHEAGNYRAAAECIDTVTPLLGGGTRLPPAEWARSFYWCGRIALDRGQFIQAERYFRAATGWVKKANTLPAEQKLAIAEHLARAVAAQERFADAVPLFEAARQLAGAKGSKADLAFADLQVATAQLATNKRADYEKTLAAMLARSGPATDAEALSWVAWTAALGGKPRGWDADALDAQLTAALKPDESAPWSYRGLALVRLRAGKLDAVEQALMKAGPEEHPVDHLIRGLLAIARSDNPAARQALKKAEEAIEAQKPAAKNALVYAGRPWHAQFASVILLSELRAGVK